MSRLVSFLLGVAIAAYGFGIWLFLLRSNDALPSRVDAVVVLAGAQSRLPLARQLVADGVSKTLVVSEASRGDDPARYDLCHGPKPKGYTLICRTATPYSTRGEAELIASLARARKWSSVAVVSSRYHLFRSRILVERCTDVRLVMRGTDGDAWWRKALAIPLEYAKLVRAETWQRGC